MKKRVIPLGSFALQDLQELNVAPDQIMERFVFLQRELMSRLQPYIERGCDLVVRDDPSGRTLFVELLVPEGIEAPADLPALAVL